MSDERGFTLVELVVGCSIMMIAAVALLGFFDQAIGGTADLQQSVQQQTDSRFGIDQLTRELRQAYTGTPSLTPVTVTATTLTFYSPDAATPMHLRKVRYRLANDVLERSVTVSTNTAGPPWTFGTDGPWATVAAARTATSSFAGVTDGKLTSIDVTLAVANSDGRADRVFRTSVGLRTLP